MSGAAGVYAGFVLTYPAQLHLTLSPAIGILAALATGWAIREGYRRIFGNPEPRFVFLLFAIAAGVVGSFCGLLVADAPGAKLYLSWAVSCLLAGAVGLAIYRGLYVYMRQRAKSPLVMLVASLGILLAITAIVPR